MLAETPAQAIFENPGGGPPRGGGRGTPKKGSKNHPIKMVIFFPELWPDPKGPGGTPPKGGGGPAALNPAKGRGKKLTPFSWVIFLDPGFYLIFLRNKLLKSKILSSNIMQI